MSVIEEKSRLRAEMKLIRNELTPEERRVSSLSVSQKLIERVEALSAKRVHVYIAIGGELDLTPFIVYCLEHTIQVYASITLPHGVLKHRRLTDLDKLESGLFDTRQPSGDGFYHGSFDIIIVPGLAFTESGERLGYGGGYYDRFMDEHPESHKIGTGYKKQLCKYVPTEPHDILMDEVLLG